MHFSKTAVSVLTLASVSLGGAMLHAEDTAPAPIAPQLVRWLEENGPRIGGVLPVRIDSPAFHDDLRDREERVQRSAPFDAASFGGITHFGRTPFVMPEGAAFSLGGMYGSFDSLYFGGSASYQKDGVGIAGGYGDRRAGAVEGGEGVLRTDSYPAASPYRYRQTELYRDAFESRNYWLKSAGAIQGGGVSYQLSYARVEAGQVLYPHLRMDAEHDTSQRVEGSVTVKSPFAGMRDLTLSGSWRNSDARLDDRFRQSAVVSNVVLPYAVKNEGELDAYGFKLTTAPDVPIGMLRIGADYSFRNPTASSTNAVQNKTNYLIPDVIAQNTGIFADYRIPAGKAGVAAGLRVDISQYDPQAASGLNAPTYAEPSGYLKGTYSPVQELELSLGLGVGVKMPDPMEMYFGTMVPAQTPLLGSPALNPSRIWQPELGAAWKTEGMNLSAVAFYSRITDYIAVRMVNAAALKRQFANGEAELWGTVLTGNAELGGGFGLQLRTAYNQGNDLAVGRPLAEVSPLTGESVLSWKSSCIFAEATERFGSRQWRVDSSLGEQQTPSWAVSDIRGGARWKSVTLTIGVNNVADTRYSTYRTWFRDPLMTGVKPPEPGRFVYGTLELVL